MRIQYLFFLFATFTLSCEQQPQSPVEQADPPMVRGINEAALEEHGFVYLKNGLKDVKYKLEPGIFTFNYHHIKPMQEKDDDDEESHYRYYLLEGDEPFIVRNGKGFLSHPYHALIIIRDDGAFAFCSTSGLAFYDKHGHLSNAEGFLEKMMFMEKFFEGMRRSGQDFYDTSRNKISPKEIPIRASDFSISLFLMLLTEQERSAALSGAFWNFFVFNHDLKKFLGLFRLYSEKLIQQAEKNGMIDADGIKFAQKLSHSIESHAQFIMEKDAYETLFPVFVTLDIALFDRYIPGRYPDQSGDVHELLQDIMYGPANRDNIPYHLLPECELDSLRLFHEWLENADIPENIKQIFREYTRYRVPRKRIARGA